MYYLFNISKSLHACTHISVFERSFLPFDDASFNRYLKSHLRKMEFVEYTIKEIVRDFYYDNIFALSE